MSARNASHAAATAGADASHSLFAAVLARQKRVVVYVAAVAVLASLAFTSQQTKTYAATAAVVVQTPLGQPASAAPNMATEAQVARSLAVANTVRQRLRLTLRPEQVLAPLSVRVPVDSTVLKFTYSSSRPQVAQQRARAFAESYLDVRRGQFESQILSSAKSISAQIDALTKQVFALQHRLADTTNPANAAILKAQRDTAAQQIGQLKQKLAGVNGSANAVPPASVLGPVPLPTHPVSPRIVVDAVLALFLGGLLGFGIAAAREHMELTGKRLLYWSRRGKPARDFGTAPIAAVDQEQTANGAKRESVNATFTRRAKAARRSR
jgi:uncharacterized protein involved in exopolysaccharide biosynthesis